MTPLIERNTTIPTRKSEVFSTAEDNQPSVLVHVLQGESEMATYNKTLGKFELVGIPPAPRGMPQIEVSFDIDANGIINVSAKDNATGNEQQIRIEGGSGLKQDEIDRMIREAEAHSDEAHRLRELVDARNNAESLAYQIEKSLNGEPREARRVARLDRRGPDHGAPRRARVGRRRRDQGEDRRAAGGVDARLRRRSTRRPRPSSRPAPNGDGAASSDDEVVEDAEYEVVDEVTRTTRTWSRPPSAAGGRSRRSTRSSRSRRERDEYLDALQRLKAEFDNYRKRVARDQQELAARAHERLVKELVPVLDDLERALEAAAEHEEAKLEDGRAARAPLARRRARAARGSPRSRPRASSTRTRRRRCSPSRPRRTRAP